MEYFLRQLERAGINRFVYGLPRPLAIILAIGAALLVQLMKG